MRQMIAFAVAVIISFWGMVIMRENGRRQETAEVSVQLLTKASDRAATISKGEAVKIEEHLTKGVWTVIEFTADW